MSLARVLLIGSFVAMLAIGVRPSSAQDPTPLPFGQRLQIPPGIPGAEVPPLELPRVDPKNRKEREDAIDRLFPPLPPVGPDFAPPLAPDGAPLTLDKLQHLALDNSPVIRQAMANVDAARGTAIQAGLYPNPQAGYEADQAGTANTAGLQGGYAQQTIITAGKLSVARGSALVEVRNAELALRRSQIDVYSQVRSAYFAALVAQENVKISKAMSSLTDEVYLIQIAQVKRGEAAAYEPLQLRVLAVQARGSLVQARNRYIAAWKQLTAAMGLPGVPPTELAGKIDAHIPCYQYDAILGHVLSTHTDVLTGQNDVFKARLDLQLARVTPVPDVTVRGMLQRDHTTPPFGVVASVQIGVPVPVWDRNQGNIQRAEAQLFHANQQTQRAQNELTGRLAEAFARYETNRTLVDYYRNRILPDQVQSYRGTYQRHQQEPARVSFGDIIVAQQILATTVSTYVSTLGDFWNAVVDLGGLLQTDDLFQFAKFEGPPPNSDLAGIMCLPAPEACVAPLPPPGLLRPDPTWPPAMPLFEEKPQR